LREVAKLALIDCNHFVIIIVFELKLAHKSPY